MAPSKQTNVTISSSINWIASTQKCLYVSRLSIINGKPHLNLNNPCCTIDPRLGSASRTSPRGAAVYILVGI